MEKKILIKINSLKKVKAFVRTANTFDSDIDLISKRHVLDAKSILGVLSANILEPLQVIICTEDKEELKRFIEAMEVFKIEDGV